MAKKTTSIVEINQDAFISEDSQIVLYQPDETIKLEVKLDDTFNTVWLSIDQMSLLFGRDKSVIGKHVRACFNEGELVKNSVWAKFAYTASDGKTYKVDYYNLDVIISREFGMLGREKIRSTGSGTRSMTQ